MPARETDVQVITGLFGWLGRKGLVFVLLVMALILTPLVVPWIRSEWTGPKTTRARLSDLQAVRGAAAEARSQGVARFGKAVTEMREASVSEIDGWLAKAKAQQAALIAQQPSGTIMTRYMRDGTSGLITEQQRGVQIALLGREIASLERARGLATARADLFRYVNLPTRLRDASSSQRACNARRTLLRKFQNEWFGNWTLFRQAERKRLTDARDGACDRARTLTAQAKREIVARKAAIRAAQHARQTFEATTVGINGVLARSTVELERQIRGDQDALDGSLTRKAEIFAARTGLLRKLKIAAWLLLGIILTPYAIRILFYFVLAPLASRRGAVRVTDQSGSGGQSGKMREIPVAAQSTTSVAVRLGPDEELLVRQDYLQSSSHGGAKSTRWLLSYRHPLSSIATGLMFLTRLRGTGEVTTVSAVRDPFAEVTIVTLPEGAACVLHPRALAAVAQPMTRTLRVTSHWRLRSLHAWLTLQLRYLAFHGPARLVLKGGRGVRVEEAARGRVFGQDQLIGFSTDLAYSVTRTEPFWPYLFGRETLLKDRVEVGAEGSQGVLIVEEAPMARRGGGGIRHGLEGAADAMLKVVGL